MSPPRPRIPFLLPSIPLENTLPVSKKNTWNEGILESFNFTSKSKLNLIVSLDLNNFKLVKTFNCYWLNKKDFFDFAFLQWSRFFSGKIFRLPLPTFFYIYKNILREGTLMRILNQMGHKSIGYALITCKRQKVSLKLALSVLNRLDALRKRFQLWLTWDHANNSISTSLLVLFVLFIN